MWIQCVEPNVDIGWSYLISWLIQCRMGVELIKNWKLLDFTLDLGQMNRFYKSIAIHFIIPVFYAASHWFLSACFFTKQTIKIWFLVNLNYVLLFELAIYLPHIVLSAQ